MSQLSEADEMQASNLPSNTESDEDQSLKCWEEVKAETGFSSYNSFLEALGRKGLGFGNLLEHLNRYSTETTGFVAKVIRAQSSFSMYSTTEARLSA